MFGKKKKKEGTHHRKKYHDQSRFLEWVNRLGLEKTTIGRGLIYVEERFNLRQVSLLFIFCFLLSLLLFANFEISTNFTVGGVAKSSVQSPLSFEMVDELATEEKRQLAQKSIAPVYDYDTDLLDRISARVFDAFQDARQYSSQLEWSKQRAGDSRKKMLDYKKDFETTLGQSVGERTYNWLIKKQFSSDIETLLVLALEKWLEDKIVNDKSTDSGTISLRIITARSTPEEISIDTASFKRIVERAQFRIKGINGVEKLSARDARSVSRLAYTLLEPNVTPNRTETAERRRKARDSVLPVVIAVKKGQVIISEGSVVQPVHISLLDRVRELQDNRRQDFRSFIAALLFMTLILVSFAYLRRFSTRKEFASNKDLFLMALVTGTVVILVKTFLFMTNATFMEKLADYLHPSTFLFAAPVAAGPMLVGLVVASGEIVWLFTVFLAAVLGLMVEQNFSFFILTLVGGMAAVRGVYACKKRNDIYWAGVLTGLVNAFVILLFMTMDHFNQVDYFEILLYTVPSAFVSGIFSAMITMILIPVIESIFNYTTDIRLLELSNLNHPLLKEMLIRAPGTYHHSMMVGTLVESAAEQIGANPLLAKVMAYYHDIGKMAHAEYFIENQRKGDNPHDHISPYMSKTILIAHVKDGAELGMKHKLGKPIIDGILQHHGTGLISYFYNKALQQVDEHAGPPSEEEFRYPGPKPQFKEAALVMLADGIEAAARALDEPTPVRLQNIVRNIIQRRFMEAQLDECNLTLRDLSKCEAAFKRILLSIYHQRLDYPKEMGGGTAESPDKDPTKTLRMMN